MTTPIIERAFQSIKCLFTSTYQQTLVSRSFYMATLIIVVTAGALFRGANLFRSLWLDEAWLANSILSPDLHGMFYYDGWLQTTPPLLLLMFRALRPASVENPEILRIVPYLFSIAAIVLFHRASTHYLKKYFALLSLCIFSFSAPIIMQAQTLKQYSSDIFFSVLFVYYFCRFLEKPSVKWYFFILLPLIVGVFISVATFFYIPFFVAIPFFVRSKNLKFFKKSMMLLHIFSILILATSTLILQYYFISPNTLPSLKQFWHEGFIEVFSIKNIIEFYYTLATRICQCLNFTIYSPMIRTLIVIAYFVMFFIAISTRVCKRNLFSRPSSLKMLLLASVVITLVVLNAIKMYPVNGNRLLSFLHPVTILIFCIGVQSIVIRLKTIARQSGLQFKVRTTTLTQVLYASSYFIVFLSLCFCFIIKHQPYSGLESLEDNRGFMHYFRGMTSDNDIVFVHSTMREQISLYASALQFSTSTMFFGNSGSPCCTRHGDDNISINPSMSIIDEIQAPLSRYVAKNSHSNSSRFFIILTDLAAHWERIERNDSDTIIAYAASLGLKVNKSFKQFNGISMFEIVK